MRKLIEKEIVACDICERELNKRTIFRNDGSYQTDYITKGGVDICFICAGKVLDIVSNTVTDENFKKMVEQTKKRVGSNHLTTLVVPKDFFKHVTKKED